MKLKDFERLKKFMNRAASDSDAEALTALRMANAILAEYDLDWVRVLDRSVQAVAEVEAAPPGSMDEGRRRPAAGPARDPRADRIASLFSELEEADEAAYGSEFIQSLRGHFARRRDLSPAQLAALEKYVERATS